MVVLFTEDLLLLYRFLRNTMQQLELARLKWACRRGMLELDVMFERYVEQRYSTADSQEQAQFQQLLTYPDQVLFDWLVKRESAEPTMQSMVHVIQHHAQSQR